MLLTSRIRMSKQSADPLRLLITCSSSKIVHQSNYKRVQLFDQAYRAKVVLFGNLLCNRAISIRLKPQIKWYCKSMKIDDPPNDCINARLKVLIMSFHPCPWNEDFRVSGRPICKYPKIYWIANHNHLRQKIARKKNSVKLFTKCWKKYR